MTIRIATSFKMNSSKFTKEIKVVSVQMKFFFKNPRRLLVASKLYI